MRSAIEWIYGLSPLATEAFGVLLLTVVAGASAVILWFVFPREGGGE